ncbi:MAG: hypothetical protein WBD07_08990 [Vicinamibacterales bacterium]
MARPASLINPLRVDFFFPQDLDFFAFGVVFQTRQPDERLVARRGRRLDLFDEVAPRPDADYLARLGRDVNRGNHGLTVVAG